MIPDASPVRAAEPTDAASLAEILLGLTATVPVASVDELWIFPTHSRGTLESTVVVVSAFHDGERRRILTARHLRRRNPKGRVDVHQELAEHGIAPADRVARLVDGVLRRLSDDFAGAAPPRAAHIGGSLDRWNGLLASLPASPAPAS